MFLQQPVVAVGYVSQDLIPQDSSFGKYMFFGLTSRKHTGQTTYLRCRVSGDLVDQFVAQYVS